MSGKNSGVAFVPDISQQSTRMRRRLRIVAAVAAVALLAAGTVFVIGWLGSCGDGVEHKGSRDECVGVSDGSFEFSDDLADVTRKILAENGWVAQQGKPFVSIAFFAPMTLMENDTTSREAVRHSLQGAYIAQRRANRTSEWNGDIPLIRLLLANPGSQAEQWEPVVERILKLRHSAENLVAVTGLGQSLEGTRKAINRLSENGIPMVGSLITADSLSETPGRTTVPGLVRVVPTNSDEVGAIVEHIKDTRRAVLVQDINTNDVFASNLGEVFKATYPRDGRVLIQPVEQFDSSLDGTANSFPRLAPEVCVARPDVIFFAGRFRDLVPLLDALAGRPCQDQRLRLVTGDSVIDIAADERVRRNLTTNITLEYVHLADPKAWEGEGRPFFHPLSTQYFQEARGEGFFLSDFPDESLDDGLAITAFDAVGTAVTAVREAVRNKKQAEKVPSPEAVTAQFHRLHGLSSVPGASGWISFDEKGNPGRKALSIIRLDATPDQLTTTVRREVTSSSGTPFLPPS